MKYHDDTYYKKKRQKEWHKEHTAGGFKCSHCKRWVVINEFIGTVNRNHCNYCLWSKHVDVKKGDRKEECHGGMKPVGLTFKHEGYARQGELMLIHECAACGRLSINRIAADDSDERILEVFEQSSAIWGELANLLAREGIAWLTVSDRKEVLKQLFGKA